jgi:hypothetical protein
MKRTTLLLDERCFVELKRLAAAQRRTLSAVVNQFLQTGLVQARRGRRPAPAPPLPKHDLGRPHVDVADRNELYRVMEGA